MTKLELALLTAFTFLLPACPPAPSQTGTYQPPPAAVHTPPDARVIKTTSSFGNTTNSRTWGIVWSDEFNGTVLDRKKWDFQPGNGVEYGISGWGNSEAQYYTQGENISFRDGNLVITARRERHINWDYTSAKLRTIGSGWVADGANAGDAATQTKLFTAKYGRIEARMKLPLGTGLWPAFWLLPADNVYGGWARSGEIDIMEAKGRRAMADHIGGAIHFGGAWPNNAFLAEDYPAQGKRDSFSIAKYHNYAVEWSEGEIIWFVDGVPYQRRAVGDWRSDGANNNSKAPFDQPFYIVLNLAVGGHFDNYQLDAADWESPAEMLVDYVRVYRAIEDGANPPNTVREKPASASSSQSNSNVRPQSKDGNGGISVAR